MIRFFIITCIIIIIIIVVVVIGTYINITGEVVEDIYLQYDLLSWRQNKAGSNLQRMVWKPLSMIHILGNYY
jgi:hypothetical protein